MLNREWTKIKLWKILIFSAERGPHSHLAWIQVRIGQQKLNNNAESGELCWAKCPISYGNLMMMIRCLRNVCERADESCHSTHFHCSFIIFVIFSFLIFTFSFSSPLVVIYSSPHKLPSQLAKNNDDEKQNCEMTCKMPNSIVLIKLRYIKRTREKRQALVSTHRSRTELQKSS